jgi:glucose/arabinose dehydrogenase
MYRILFIFLLASFKALAQEPQDLAEAPPASISKLVELRVLVESGLKNPVLLTFAPGDTSERLFVVERAGTIRIIKDGALEKRPFLDLTKKVESGYIERGLLGLAFHPNYQKNGKLYVNYIDLSKNTRVAEFTVEASDLNLADPSSEKEILSVKQPYANHNGGHLTFGPDGLLYVLTGDGGSSGDPKKYSQNPKSKLGKMIRVDVDAPKPTTEIIGLGLRNPWRYSFDRKTGELYIADVGQKEYEEVNILAHDKLEGHNFGWNITEGNHCYKKKTCDTKKFTAPAFEYSHKVGCSITGGFVYRGKALPELDGLYFYADYCTGLLRSFRWKDGRIQDHWDWKALLDPEDQLATLASFGEDQDGALYLISHDGIIYQFIRKK